MGNGATLSVLGLYNVDNTIFDFMQFPDAFTAAQKQTVIDSILVECAEFECLYPVPLVLKNIIGIWSRKESPYWNRIYNASLLEYNPIENYHRTETETIDDDRTEEHSGSDVATAGGSDTQSGNSSSTDTNSGSDTETNSVTGFDSDTLVPHDESVMAYGHVLSNYAAGSNTNTYGRTDTMQHGEKIEHTGGTDRTLEAFGNIGTMTSQEMLTSELEIAKIANVMNVIIDSFKERFCIMVY